MQQLAAKAAGLWGFDAASLTLAAHRENAVFRLETGQGTFALRLHRPGYRSNQELESELQFMAMLSLHGVAVPAPIASGRGQFFEVLDGTQVSVLTWLAGKPLGTTGQPLVVADRLGTFRRFGKLIASLHDAADEWSPPHGFSRQAWDREGLLGEQPQWGRFWDTPYLMPDQRTILQHTREKLRRELQSRPFDQGLIHADLVCENILMDGETIRIIDFDDFGPGFRLQDLATALVKFEAEPDFEDLRSALFEGYESLRPLDRDGVSLFLMIRHLTYVGWIVPRMQGPEGEARCKRFISNAIPKALAYLAG